MSGSATQKLDEVRPEVKAEVLRLTTLHFEWEQELLRRDRERVASIFRGWGLNVG